MRHAVVMLCHRDLSLVERHIRFFDDDFSFYVHIDRGSKISNTELKEFAFHNPRVRVFRKYRVRWGGIGILKAELFLLRKVIEDGGADFVHICSGQDFPVRSLSEIKEFFDHNRGRQFMECHVLPYSGWGATPMWRLEMFHSFDFADQRTKSGQFIQKHLCRIQENLGFQRRLPSQFKCLYGGSNWMSLSGECADFIVHGNKTIRSFLNRLRFCFASDEIFFQTVVMNSPFADSVVTDNKRLIIWKPGSSSPEILTVQDWDKIVSFEVFWGRKFCLPESGTLMRMLLKHFGELPVDSRNPSVESDNLKCLHPYMDTPLLTVIVPVYNTAEYLEECLGSIAWAHSNVECVVIDDGSSDNSPEIIREYVDADPRFRCFTQENKGLSEARNRGLAEARGKYVLFVDSDDVVDAEAIMNMLQIAMNTNADIVTGNLICIDADGVLSPWGKHVETGTYGSGAEFLRHMHGDATYFPMAQCYMIRTELISECGLSFHKGIMHEDELWTPLLLMHAATTVASGINHYGYRTYRDQSITHSHDDDFRFQSLTLVISKLIDVSAAFSPESDVIRLSTPFLKWRLAELLKICSRLASQSGESDLNSSLCPIEDKVRAFTSWLDGGEADS